MSLLLANFGISNYRCFFDLRLQRLGNVNLIVGRNSVGKSALLEAMYLYAEAGNPSTMLKLVEYRQEYNFALAQEQGASELFGFLFHGFRMDADNAIKLGPLDDHKSAVTIRPGWYRLEDNAEGPRRVVPLKYPDLESEPALLVSNWSTRDLVYPLKEKAPFYPSPRVRPQQERLPVMYVPSGGLDPYDAGRLWDRIALTDLEDEVLSSLRLVLPTAQGLSLVAAQRREASARYGGGRIFVIKVSDLEKPVPVTSMGEGTQRILSLALALLSARNGLLLIDEIENGVHYTALPKLWRFIFDVARRSKVQVFATTHSWDCVEAFGRAATDYRADMKSTLIRLENRKGKISGVEFTEQELDIVTADGIEVR
ncbi:MAG: AAA family ATPase [Firmicutes bacterium]|nr:AAA family ATPase [Bacillota bacterium]